MMKKRTKRFDDGGMASSGPQSAFYQPRNPNPLPPNSGQGLFSFAPDTGSGVGGVGSARTTPGPLDLGQRQQEPFMQEMRRGGKVKAKTKPKAYAAGGAVKKTRGDGCCQKGKTRGTMR